jgi:hypothetical protein
MAQDHGCIAVSYDKVTQTLTLVETTQLSFSEKYNPTKTFAKYQNPLVTPGTPGYVLDQKFGGSGFFFILTPFVNCSVNDLVFLFRDTTNPEIGTTTSFSYNGTVQNPTTIPSIIDFLTSWLPITLTGNTSVVAGDKSTYTVNCPAGTTVYISSDIGIINRSQVTNGQSFVLDTSGLHAGETVKIKLGYKFWSGVSTQNILIV